MQVDHAVGAGREAPANQLVIVSEVGRIQGPAKVVVDEVLPRDGEAEDVEVVCGDEMEHLGGAVAQGVVWVAVCWRNIGQWCVDLIKVTGAFLIAI